MKVKFKRLHEDAVIPSYAKPGDAGLDLTTVTDGFGADKYIQYKFGLACEIPEGYVGLIFPRSSISKIDLILSNCVGVIDSGYRGEIQVRFKNTIIFRNRCEISGDIYKKGDKIAQMIIMPYPTIEPEWAETLTDTDRGTGGFGHTDSL